MTKSSEEAKEQILTQIGLSKKTVTSTRSYMQTVTLSISQLKTMNNSLFPSLFEESIKNNN